MKRRHAKKFNIMNLMNLHNMILVLLHILLILLVIIYIYMNFINQEETESINIIIIETYNEAIEDLITDITCEIIESI